MVSNTCSAKKQDCSLRETDIEYPHKTTETADPANQQHQVDLSRLDKEEASPKFVKKSASSRRATISYEAAVWTIFLSLITLAIVDRFTTNVWPRQTYSIGAGSAGSDRLEGYKPGPWSVKAYDIIARVSGRFALFCFNLLLVTRLNSLQHVLASSTFVNNYLLDCSDIVNANTRLHRWNAIALCVVTVLHVWSILMPCVTHGWSAQVVPGHFEYPLSERTPKGFKDANPETETMSLQVDDVWRIVEMTVMLCILMPLSIRWLAARWHIGMPLHQLLMVLYFVDIVRRHSHPHSWILNTPFFVLWILDKIWQVLWRRSKCTNVHRIHLGDDYMVLLWKMPQSLSHAINTVGPDYFLRLQDSSVWEGRHAFTAFQNRGNLLPFDFDWTAGTIVRVFHDKRKPRLGERKSLTQRIYDKLDDPLHLTIWGPTYGEMSEHVRYSLQESHKLVLIGAGSGVGYILDALQYSIEHHCCSYLTLLLTTRSNELYSFLVQTLREICHFEVVSSTKIVLAITCRSGDKAPLPEQTLQVAHTCGNSVLLQKSRIDFSSYVESGSIVFCQGGIALKENVARTCRKAGARFYGGRGGGR